ncbi:MAG TPA: hypothetical protein VHL09_06360 [Dehalococcoidia bacterium]|nr:hypothetical protein [Dehalococcoidia bacterium]
MALISERDQEKIREIFADRLQYDVRITCFAQRGSALIVPGHQHQHHTGRETRQLLEELAGLTDRLHVEIKDFEEGNPEAQASGIQRAPAIILHGQAKGQVRFFGLPSGYEFSTLIEDLLTVSSGETSLGQETRAALAAIAQPVHIQVFGTPT